VSSPRRLTSWTRPTLSSWTSWTTKECQPNEETTGIRYRPYNQRTISKVKAIGFSYTIHTTLPM
jgi:hypothetical protein